MSIDYRLTLAGDIPLEQLAELAAPGATEIPSPAGNRLLSADFNDEYGYVVSITSGTNGYYEAEDDDGTQWQWEPKTYLDVTFHMRKDTLANQGRPHMFRTVATVLANRPEDAALTLNSDSLLLTRIDGRIRRHNTADWHDDGILPD